MAWITITEDDVLTVLSGAELEGYRAAALADGQVDPVDPTIAQVTDLVRGYVAGNPANTLGATGIPQKLLPPALDIIAYRIPNRVGQDAGETRKALQDQAIRLLEQVAAGKFGIEEPETASTEDNAGGIQVASSSTRKTGRDNLSGL